MDQDPFIISNGEEISLAIQGWVKLFIQHLHAKSILESFARRGGNEVPIELKIYGINSPENRLDRLQLPTWDALEIIIRSSLQNMTTDEQDKYINVFQSYFSNSTIEAQADGDIFWQKQHIQHDR